MKIGWVVLTNELNADDNLFGGGKNLHTIGLQKVKEAEHRRGLIFIYPGSMNIAFSRSQIGNVLIL